MKKITKNFFSYSADKNGYSLYYDGIYIGSRGYYSANHKGLFARFFRWLWTRKAKEAIETICYFHDRVNQVANDSITSL